MKIYVDTCHWRAAAGMQNFAQKFADFTLARNFGVKMTTTSKTSKRVVNAYDEDLVGEKCQLDFDRQKKAQANALKMMSKYL